MPATVRIMNWNIEAFSYEKCYNAGVAEAVAKVVVDEDVDILFVVELRNCPVGTPQQTMAHLSAQLNAAARAAAVAANAAGSRDADYTCWAITPPTGTEYYGFVIKDIAKVRPVAPNPLPAEPLRDINVHTPENGNNNNNQAQNITWRTLPAAFGNAANQQGRVATFPLLNLHAISANTNTRKRNFTGQAKDQGGYAEGRGFRLPCLAMFEVGDGGGGRVLLPLIGCHFAAQGRAAGEQLRDMLYLHPVQLYRSGGWIDLNGQARRLDNLLLTGDFNIDFPGTTQVERAGYQSFTPTLWGAGSGNPAAAAPQAAAQPNLPIPATQALAIDMQNLPTVALKAAVTVRCTHLRTYDDDNYSALYDRCYDNFLFGGAEAAGANQLSILDNPDAGLVVDLPARLSLPGGGGLEIGHIVTHYGQLEKRAGWYPVAQRLVDGSKPLHNGARLVGARMISDHVPVVLELTNL